jgi:excisionase family DNA binding protein
MNRIGPLLTSEVARILDVSAETVRLWERNGRLRAQKTEKGVRLFDRADVVALAERLAREREGQQRTMPTSALPVVVAA